MTMEQVLQNIVHERGMSALRNGETLIGLFQDLSRNQLGPQANALKVFVSCQGNTRILNLQNAPLQEQQVQLHRLVQEMTTQHNMREDTAVEVCSAFWRAAIGTEFPVPSGQQKEMMEEPEQDRKFPGDRIPEIEKARLRKDPEPLPVPDSPSPKPRPFRGKKLVLPGLAVLLALMVLSFLVGGDSGKRTRSDLKPYNLEDSIEDLLLAGTEEIYTYPDGTWMEFYYDDAGQEICRIYVNQENDIENLFEARYDDTGRLVYHQIFDGEGILLRSDSYNFQSNENTAQRRITLGDGRSFQGQSTFDENGYETFTLNHQDGTKTVYVYMDGGVLTNLTEYDAEGEETVTQAAAYGPDWKNAPKIYGPRQTVMGWNNGETYTHSYVQGLCGGALKEYSVNDAASEEDRVAFLDIYDPMGNLLEMRHYDDTQMQRLLSHEIHSYDQQGNYTGYADFFYYPDEDRDYILEQYDANKIRLSQEIHRFEGKEETVLSTRYETEVDDQGRAVCVREYDGTTGRLEAIEENEYDAEGNLLKETRTAYYDDGRYNIRVRNGDWKTLSSITYYPSGSISEIQEYTAEGLLTKWTEYYENGQIKDLTEYNAAGERSKSTEYYESGALKGVDEYSDAGKPSKSTDYYENGQVESVNAYNDAGDIIKSIDYDENGNVRYSFEYRYEYDADGNIIKEIQLDDQGAVTGWETNLYNGAGKKEKTTYYDAGGKMTGWSEYSYDENGHFLDSEYHPAN